MERRRLTFRGHVQGVGFRVSANALVKPFPLTGFIQNDRDGAVTMEVQGDPVQIDLYLLDVRERMGGYIKEEEIVPLPVVHTEPVFEIRH